MPRTVHEFIGFLAVTEACLRPVAGKYLTEAIEAEVNNSNRDGEGQSYKAEDPKQGRNDKSGRDADKSNKYSDEKHSITLTEAERAASVSGGKIPDPAWAMLVDIEC